MLHDINKAYIPFVITALADVFEAVVAAVDGGTDIKRTGVAAVLEGLEAVAAGLSAASTLTFVADGGKETPEECPTVKVGKATGLTGSPTIDTLSSIAGRLIAPEAGTALVQTRH